MNLELALILVLSVTIFCVGLASLFLQRGPLGTLKGQIILLKGILLSVVAFAANGGELGAQFVILALVVLALAFFLVLLGTAVIVRCQRKDGSLEYELETELRN